MKTLSTRLLAAAALAATAAMPAFAQDYYISGSVGLVDQSNSSNEGATGAFTTGNLGDGTTLDVAAGTDYGWETEFDSGTAFALELGMRKDSGLRFGLEGVLSSADVETHRDVTLGGGAIGALDAASIASSADPLGVTVAQVVADGQGEIEQTALFLNGYYDFALSDTLSPYLGVGVGLADVDVTYAPSGIGVIDDGQTKFAYQGKAGLTLGFDAPVEVFGEVAYRATSDVETENTLFPGTLDVENKQLAFSAGLRFTFGQ